MKNKKYFFCFKMIEQHKMLDHNFQSESLDDPRTEFLLIE